VEKEEAEHWNRGTEGTRANAELLKA